MASFIVATVVVVVADYVVSCLHRARAEAPVGDFTDVKVPEGLPSEMVRYSAFSVSFNPETHTPNYVAWELTGEHARGKLKRSNKFVADPDVEGSATPEDYRNSGFDRGHMAPAGDMKWSTQAMEESFYMTNIVPQNHELNRGVWNRLEEKCRQRAVSDSAIVIICGPVPGDAVDMRIGYNQVAVPQRFFKVILSPYTNPPLAIGFILPNGYPKGGMQPYAVSVDKVEEVTGYDFFYQLPDSIENKIESKCNFNRWSQIH